MAAAVGYQLAGSNVVITLKPQSKTYNDFLGTVKERFGTTAGAYDLLKEIKNVCIILGSSYSYLAERADKFLTVTSVARAFPTFYTVVEATGGIIRKAWDNRQHIERIWVDARLQRVANYSHQVVDCLAMWTFSAAFFCRESTPFVNAGKMLLAACDLTDVISSAAKIRDSWNWDANLAMDDEDANRELHLIANNNSLTNNKIRLIKSIIALAGSIFSCLILAEIMSTSIVAAAAIGVTTAFLSMVADLHENYWCENFPKTSFAAAIVIHQD